MSEAISIEQWEHSKENILPVKSGRKAAELALVFGTKRTTSVIDQERQQYEEKIQNNTEDPLSSWLEYYTWAKERFPNNHVEQLKIVQNITKIFCNTEMYQQDERYLRIWIIYSDMLTNPVDMFQYLLNKELCTDWAILYEAYALALENSENYKDADEMFKLGINRRAHPVDALKSKYSRFLVRMSEYLARRQQLAEEESQEPASGRRESRPRTALSRLGGTSSSRMGSSANSNSARVSLITVLSDSDIAAGSDISDEFKVRWNEFSTEQESTKENIRLAVGWSGQTLPQKKVRSSKSKPKPKGFAIYVDPDCETESQTNDDDDGDDEMYYKMIAQIKARTKTSEPK